MIEHTLHPAFEKGVAAEEAARRNHYEEEMAAESFWKKAAASLPPRPRRRYAHLFEAAERYEPVVEFIVELFHRPRSERTTLKGRVRESAHA